MKAGFFTADITPTIGMERPADYYKAYIDAIHDPLKVRAVVLDQEDTTLVFVGVDTCEFSIPDRLTAAVRRAVTERCGIPGTNILIAASHTHSGGPLAGPWLDVYDDAPELVRTLVRDHTIVPDPQYYAWVVQQIVSAVCEAHRRREEVLLSVGAGIEDQVLFNRRFRMANGRVYTHPGKGNPDILEPAGPVDPMVGVLAAWRLDGTLLGCVVNYSCHCTVFTGGVSADYVYSIEQTIQAVMGRQASVVFLPGAAGDVTQVDNRSLREREFGERWSRRVGTRVGAEVLKVLISAEPADLVPLASASITLQIARRPPSPQRLASSWHTVEQGLRLGMFDTEWLFAKELLLLDHLIRKHPLMEVEVQALQVGPVVFLANPAEYFAESGLAIKHRSPFPLTFVVTLANGEAGYVPPASAFAPDGGGYETVLSSYSNLEITAAEQIADASIALARSLTPSDLPQPASIATPQSAWTYGMLGPDLS